MEEEFRFEVTCFKSWGEWIELCELMLPNLANIQNFKTAFHREKLPVSYYYTFILDNVLNTREKLEKALIFLEQILSRNEKFNPISVIATNQFLRHFLSLKYEENPSNEKILLDIIRTISQFSDIYQESHKMNKSISRVLESINMKEGLFISEVRHMATHKELPSKILIQKSVEYMLEFLIENYWGKIYRKVKGGFKEQRLFARNVDGFKEEIRRKLGEIDKKQDFEEIFNEFIKNLKKNKFKCAILLSEVLRGIIKEGLEGGREKAKVLREILSEIFGVKEKRLIGKLIKFPFIRYKILRILSLKKIEIVFEEVSCMFFSKFYAKNDKNFAFMKKLEEEIFNQEEKEKQKEFSTEEIEEFLDKNKEKIPSYLLQ